MPPHHSSILRLAWTEDCTRLGGAGSNGSVVFIHLIERYGGRSSDGGQGWAVGPVVRRSSRITRSGVAVAAVVRTCSCLCWLMSRAVEWKNYEVLLLAEDAVRVRDIVSNVKEQLGISNIVN